LIPIRGPARAHERNVALGEAVTGYELTDDERIAGRNRIDRDRLSFEAGERLDRRRRDHRRESAVAADEREEVGVVRNLRFALALLVGDQIVDRGGGEIGLAVEQRLHEKRRARRVREL